MSPPPSEPGSRASSKGEARDRIRIVIADDHDLYRRGMQAVIGLEPDLEIVAEAASGVEAVEKVFEYEPDVVLLDVRMPGNSGIEACTAIKEKAPRTKILILTASDDESDLFSAIKAGASGYLLKDLPTEQIAAVGAHGPRGPVDDPAAHGQPAHRRVLPAEQRAAQGRRTRSAPHRP